MSTVVGCVQDLDIFRCKIDKARWILPLSRGHITVQHPHFISIINCRSSPERQQQHHKTASQLFRAANPRSHSSIVVVAQNKVRLSPRGHNAVVVVHSLRRAVAFRKSSLPVAEVKLAPKKGTKQKLNGMLNSGLSLLP